MVEYLCYETGFLTPNIKIKRSHETRDNWTKGVKVPNTDLHPSFPLYTVWHNAAKHQQRLFKKTQKLRKNP